MATVTDISADYISAILNWVCPECGGPMGGRSMEFQYRGRCGTDWRSVWENAFCIQSRATLRNMALSSGRRRQRRRAPTEFHEHCSEKRM